MISVNCLWEKVCFQTVKPALFGLTIADARKAGNGDGWPPRNGRVGEGDPHARFVFGEIQDDHIMAFCAHNATYKFIIYTHPVF